MSKRPINKLLFESPAVLNGQDLELTRRDFDFERRLGDGAFGQVWRVKHKTTLKVYAMKQVPKEKVMKMLGQFRREVFIMYELSHPHIIKLYNHFEDEKFFYLIMELAEGGNLFHKLYREKCFLERNAAQYFREVVLAVEYLHSHVPAIIHRDIKPENILLDKEGRIKLTDFGWSNYYSADNPTLRFTMCGTLEYLPPEIVTETGHNTGADIWCLGILLFEMLTGATPFNSKGRDQMLTNITNAKAKFPHSMPPLAKDLISKMIEKDPTKRISAKDIKNHGWLMQHKPIRETISQECMPRVLPSLEEINKVIGTYAPAKPVPDVGPAMVISELVEEEKMKEEKALEEKERERNRLVEGNEDRKEQSKNDDNSKKNLSVYGNNEFRRSVTKLKQHVVVKSEDNTKIKHSIQEYIGKVSELNGKTKTIEDQIAEQRKEIGTLNASAKEVLSRLADCNVELERINTINLSLITEKINQKNSDLLEKTTQAKQQKNKYENLKNISQKALLDFNEKEKTLASQILILKKMKEKLSTSNSGKKSEISELETSAEVLKSRLLGDSRSTVKLGRHEKSVANEIMALIREETQNLGTFLRLKLDKQLNQLQEKVSEKEQELAEAKIYFEEMKSHIMQNSRMKKDEIVRSGKRKNEMIRLSSVSRVQESTATFRQALSTARNEENKYYIDSIEIFKARENIKVIQR